MTGPGPELIGDQLLGARLFRTWEDDNTKVCVVCGGLVPLDEQPTHLKFHLEIGTVLPADWRQDIKSLVIQAWATPHIGAEGLTARLVAMIDAWLGHVESRAPAEVDARVAALKAAMYGALYEDDRCSSLLLRDGQLHTCVVPLSHHQPAPDGGGWHRSRVTPKDSARPSIYQWDDQQEVPTWWPADQEPPAGINTLACNTPHVSSDSVERWWIHRTGDGWTLWPAAEPPPEGFALSLSWGAATAKVARLGDLVVARP